MSRALTAALLLAGLAGVADAGPTRKVRIETNPAGAIVYIDAKENGPACQPTPCTLDLPVGETNIIVELPSYNSEFKTIVVPKRGKVKFEPVTLDPAVGTLDIPGPAGASITVDGEDKGKAPANIEVSADTHKVVVTKDGKTLYDQYVEVATGEDKPITVGAAAAGSSDDDERPGEGGIATDPGTDIVKAAPRAPRPPIASLAVAMNVGFRTFTYANNQTRDQLRDESESGQVLLGPMLELWPGVPTGIALLRGFSVVGRFQFRINEQPVSGGGIQGSLSTFWQSFEVSARQKFILAERYGVEVGGGWTREQYRFNGTPRDKELVPDAMYTAIRLGVRLSMLLPGTMMDFEPYADVDYRFVSDGGPMQDRFGPSTSVNGFKGTLGLLARRGGFHIRAEASLVRYAWTFEPDAAMTRIADSGTDVIRLLGVYAGYAY